MGVKPYRLMSCADLREVLHRRARGEQELLEAVEDVDPASIYYHTHSYYLRGKYRHDRYPNDFAEWVADHVRDRVLSERLSALDPWTMTDLEALRRAIAGLLQDRVDELGFSPRVLLGDAFEFIRTHLIPVPTGLEARTRTELREALRAAPPEALFYHFFEDAFRRGRRTGSIVDWVQSELRDEPLAAAMARVNPYRLHLETLRSDLLEAFDGADGR